MINSKSYIIAIILATILLLPGVVLAANHYTPGEILVRYKPGKGLTLAAASAKQGLAVKKTISQIRFHVLKVPEGLTLDQAVAKISADPNVDYVGLNHSIHICSDPPQRWPNDPVFTDGYDLWDLGILIMPNQSGLYNDGYNLGNGGTYRDDIHAPEAWYITTGSPDVVIADVDTGVNNLHEDLSAPGKVLDGYNAITDSTNSMDDNGHGTFTAGIAAASTDNGIGIAGVSWLSPILPVKVIDSTGYGTEADGAAGIIWAVDHGAKVLNCSFATDIDSPALHDAVDYAWNHGCLIVCASGNENVGVPRWPAAYDHALAVGATNENDQRCTTADWGSGGSNYGSYLDVMAPGNNITSTWSDPDLGDIYYAAPGTSAAAPFVSGVAALIWSIHPGWTNQQVFDQIIHTADDKGDPGWDQYYGWGRVNAYRALTETYTPPPTATNIGQLKRAGAGAIASFTGKVVTAGTGQLTNMAYVEEPDRSSGIMVYYTSGVPAGFAVGDRVNVSGTVSTRNGELFLAGTLTRTSSGTALKPLAMTGKAAMTGIAQGLLVTVFGKATEVGWDYLYVDDGSNLLDSVGAFTGIRVNIPSTYGINQYDQVSVTGLLGMDFPTGASSPVPVIRPRKPGDVRVVQHAP